MPARDLYRLVALVENLYSWHVLLNHMDVEYVDDPTQFLPPPEEELLINRLEIGTPNFIEFLGQVQPLIDSLAWLASIGGGALTTVNVVKGWYEIQLTRASVREKRALAVKAEREVEQAAQQGRLVVQSASELISHPDLLARTRAHSTSFSEQELLEKEHFMYYAQATASELLPSFAREPKLTVLEGDEDG